MSLTWGGRSGVTTWTSGLLPIPRSTPVETIISWASPSNMTPPLSPLAARKLVGDVGAWPTESIPAPQTLTPPPLLPSSTTETRGIIGRQCNVFGDEPDPFGGERMSMKSAMAARLSLHLWPPPPAILSAAQAVDLPRRRIPPMAMATTAVTLQLSSPRPTAENMTRWATRDSRSPSCHAADGAPGSARPAPRHGPLPYALVSVFIDCATLREAHVR